MMYSFFKKQQGFSLVEVLVAITILLLVLVGPMRMISQSNQSTSYATDQVTASFLAQEGLELLQNRLQGLTLGNYRDLIVGTDANPDPWVKFQQDFAVCTGGNSCGLYPTTTTLPYVATTTASCSGTVCLLYLNSNPGLRDRYTHLAAGNIPTPFTREIKMKVIKDSSGVVEGAWATSTVTWRSAGFIRVQKIELVTYFTNVHGTK